MREFWFESDGLPLFAVEEGEGPAIVMLHGGLANHQAALPPIASLIRGTESSHPISEAAGNREAASC